MTLNDFRLIELEAEEARSLSANRCANASANRGMPPTAVIAAAWQAEKTRQLVLHIQQDEENLAAAALRAGMLVYEPLSKGQFNVLISMDTADAAPFLV